MFCVNVGTKVGVFSEKGRLSVSCWCAERARMRLKNGCVTANELRERSDVNGEWLVIKVEEVVIVVMVRRW